jgi:capreomycidine synthase
MKYDDSALTLSRSSATQIGPALLEEWLRQYYFDTEIDIGSSGVENFSLGDVFKIVGISTEVLTQTVFNDSPSLGAKGLRRAIAQRWGSGDTDQVLATHGSSEVIFLIMNSLLEEGDEVVVLDPCYHALRNIAESIGCELKNWPLRFEHDFLPDIEEARRLITSRTRMVVVNFPHNPTGATLSIQDFNELVAIAAEADAYLVWDAAFSDLTYESRPLPDPTALYHKAISLGTLSKGYGLAGLRVGWCLASPDLLMRFVRLRDYTTLYLSPLVEVIAQRVIEKADLLLGIRLSRARENLDILADWVGRNREFVEWVRPQGGVTAFVLLRSIPDVEEFCHRFARDYGVMLVPGSCFNHPDYVRLGFGGPTADLEEGLSRLSRALIAHRSVIQFSS